MWDADPYLSRTPIKQQSVGNYAIDTGGLELVRGNRRFGYFALKK